jgi:hypothetical protein
MKNARSENVNRPETARPASSLAMPMKTRAGRWAIFVPGILLLPILLLGLLPGAFGAVMPAEQASNVVSGWLQANVSPLHMTLGQKVRQVQTFTDAAGAPLYHVVYLKPDGFVIVAADDLVEPIIGFAPGGRFDPSTNNPLGALVSHDLPNRIARARGIPAARVAGLHLAARNKWERLQHSEPVTNGLAFSAASVSDVRVPPLTQTVWSQSTVSGNACYNYYTPPGAEGTATNYVCGCVATAMAQLMRFWQWPINGVGTGSFTIYVDGVSQSRSLRGGDGSGGAYVWANQVVNPLSSSTLVQRQAIGALCADAGVSVQMQYAAGGSGAYMENVPGALTGTFGYANAICGDNNNANIGAGLNGMVNPNLDAGCPVLFGITDGSSGHAIVCDGYGYNSATLYHHLNLGWAGYCTAWYNLPTIDAGSYTFNVIDACVYNVWTNGTGEIISGRVTDKNGNVLAGVGVTAVRSGGGTYTATSGTNGIYALAKIPSASTYTVSATKTGYVFTSRTVTTGLSANYSATSGNQWAVDFAPTDDLNVTPATGLVSTGSLGGSFTPSSQTYVLTNTGTGALNWIAGTTSNWVSLSATSGTLAARGFANVTATLHASALAVGAYTNAITFSNVTSGAAGLTRLATLTVATPRIGRFSLDTDPGWTRQGQWAFGPPTGAGGASYGHADPTSGATGTNVFGVNLSGDYSTTVGGPYYLIAGPLNFTGCTNVLLQFKRWLNSDFYPYVSDTVEVSSNGTAWTPVFTNVNSEIADSAWTNCQYDLSATAANRAGVYVRWGYKVASGAFAYSGWNLDDIEFLGLPPRVAGLGIGMSGTNAVINGTNGILGGTYYVLASTNLTVPWTNWPVVATNSFDGSGCGKYTNLVSPGSPQRFFRIQVP